MSRRSTIELARTDFGSIPRYASGSAVAVNLADNTHQWGTPPAALAALREGAEGGAADYPDLYGASLKSAVAARAGVEASCVVTGNGSDDLLDCAIRAFASPGDRIAHPDPTFVMLPVFARINGITPVPVPLAADGAMDADALLATEARIIYLCSPNNPTGTSTPRETILRIVAEAPGLVIIDEAYAEFAEDEGFLSQAPSLERVLVCRTLSKAYGLAGLRVGYGTGSAAIVEMVERSRGPYKLNAFAERAAVAALTDDAAWVRERAAVAVANRERLAEGLRALGFAPLPSAANFLFVPTAEALAIGDALRGVGIGVRAFADVPGFGPALRITSAPWPVLERLLSVLSERPR